MKRPVIDQPIRPIVSQVPPTTTTTTTTTIRPYQRRSDLISPNAISNYFHPNSGRSSYNSLFDYAPQDFKCGTSKIRNKHMWGMLRIIGGKTARKGQWPWQVLVLNRLKVNTIICLIITVHLIIDKILHARNQFVVEH